MYQSRDGASVFDIWIDAAEASGSRSDPDASVVFPDKDVLFTADFKRSGTDLLLTRQETTAVILDYFRGDRRLSITTPEGASLTGETVEALAGSDLQGQYAQLSGAATVRAPIGRVEKVAGTATVLRNGISVDLQVGDMVAKGDVVQTGSGSSLAIKFNDGTVFSLSASARLVLNDMVYAADSSSNSALFTLVQGLIGFVAGRIAKTGDLKVDTPVATMAIRGTAVQAEVAALSGATRFSLLTEPDGTVGSFLLLDKSNPSRVITSISDARISTLLTPVVGSERASRRSRRQVTTFGGKAILSVISSRCLPLSLVKGGAAATLKMDRSFRQVCLSRSTRQTHQNSPSSFPWVGAQCPETKPFQSLHPLLCRFLAELSRMDRSRGSMRCRMVSGQGA